MSLLDKDHGPEPIGPCWFANKAWSPFLDPLGCDPTYGSWHQTHQDRSFLVVFRYMVDQGLVGLTHHLF